MGALQELAPATLDTTAAQLGFEVDAQAVAELLSSLPLYPDAREALELSRGRGDRVAVLSNGGRESTEKLLRGAGVRDLVDDVFGVDEVEAYKPDPRPYRLAVERLGGSPQEVVLVAAHAWDVLGALGAGLRAVWVDRGERVWPFPQAEPPGRAADLVAAVRAS